MASVDFATVKAAAAGRWPEIFIYLGIPGESLTGKHCSCPGCGGKDRFRYLDDDNGGWICGQGGVATGGDGFNLLVHIGYSKSDALHAVAQYFGFENVTLSPRKRAEIQKCKQQAMREKQEATLSHDLHKLLQIISLRIAERINASNRAFINANPGFKPLPDEHWQREIELVNTIRYLFKQLYGDAT